MQKNDSNLTKKVSGRYLLLTFFIVLMLVVLVWYKEAGEKWAAFILATIPVIGVIYYFRIPHEKRIEAEKNVNEELKKTTIGKFWIFLKWSLFIIVGIAVVVSFVK
ncbi:MAG: hypothetical protein AMJ53_09015 [Gammaproteobacteria bacterium SG8_11]|nr:MAG: hypothetical protein AMJ53_09015 [Gammaproteobacteria bacterium SG8_11]